MSKQIQRLKLQMEYLQKQNRELIQLKKRKRKKQVNKMTLAQTKGKFHSQDQDQNIYKHRASLNTITSKNLEKNSPRIKKRHMSSFCDKDSSVKKFQEKLIAETTERRIPRNKNGHCISSIQIDHHRMRNPDSINNVSSRSSNVRSVSVDNSTLTDIIKTQKQCGNLVRNNLERYKRQITPPIPKEDLEDDNLTTRSVVSTISNQGKLETVNQYKLIKLIGQGSFGKVYLCKDTNTKEQYAIKILDKKQTSWKLLSKSQTVLHNILNEVAVMKKLHHPNVVRLIEVLDQPGDDTIVICKIECK